MLKLATLLQNPGEPDITTQYKDPKALASLGYNGLVLYSTTGLSGVTSPDEIVDRELSRWVAQQLDETARRVDEAVAAGLDVYISYDMLVLPRDYVQSHAAELCCKGTTDTICPASNLAIARSMTALESLVHRLPKIAGVVLRLGDTDARRLPYLVGNDLYSPHCSRCSQLGRADRVIAAIEQAYDLVALKLDRRLIVRAWNVRPSGFHDSPELAQRIVARLPGSPDDDRLVLSFKFTQTDFWRYQPWNQSSILAGGKTKAGRPILYELQCQREFEGKGGVPNYQPTLWRDGLPEATLPDSETPDSGGLAQVADQVNLAGLWAWVRGGGWGGPFVQEEAWIDANVAAVPQLADDPSANVMLLAKQWCKDRLHLDEPDLINAVTGILERSAELAREAFYFGPFTATKGSCWHPAADWVSDDQLNAEACWRIIQRIPEDELELAVQEKEHAAEQISSDRHLLQSLVGDRNHDRLQSLVNTLIYAESLYAAMRDLTAGLVAYRRFRDTGNRDFADAARGRMFSAQSEWNHHAQRHAMLPGTATPFREFGFWELTQRVLDEVG
ncbi:MAG: hypothetical protein AAF085_03075 [Planctomycetota bacterium]